MEISPIHTIRMDDAALDRLLAALDDSSAMFPRDDGADTRYSYRAMIIVALMKQPGDTQIRPYFVHTRDISAWGMSFLHGGYVHVGTNCTLRLVSKLAEWKTVNSQVVGCSYLNKNIHEIRVKFESKIDPIQYAEPRT